MFFLHLLVDNYILYTVQNLPFVLEHPVYAARSAGFSNNQNVKVSTEFSSNPGLSIQCYQIGLFRYYADLLRIVK
jgi:hypothetical protein